MKKPPWELSKRQVLDLIRRGSYVAPHNALKSEIREHNSRLYHEVEALRKFIIDNAIGKATK